MLIKTLHCYNITFFIKMQQNNTQNLKNIFATQLLNPRRGLRPRGRRPWGRERVGWVRCN